MKARVAKKMLVVAMLVGAPAVAQSALPGFELEKLELNSGDSGSLVVGTGKFEAPGSLRVSLVGHHEHAPLRFKSADGRSAVVEGRTTTHLTAAYMVTERLEVGMQLPFVVRQASANLDYLGLAAPASFGLATPVLHARYGLLDEGESGLADVAVELGVGLPLGSADALGRDAFRVVPKVAAGRSFGLFRVGLEAGALLRPTVSLSPGSPDARDQVGSAVRLGASVTTTNQGVRGELDVRASLPLVKSPGAVEVLGGARYQVSRAWELFALAGVGLGTEPGTPQFRVLAGITFGGDTKRPVPLPMPVAALACPNDADALRTASGAELRDSDGDGQPDASDAAPCTDEHKRVAEDFERQLQLLSEKIYFAFGSDKVSKPSTYVLDEIAELLNRHPEVELVHVAGHTDIIGPHRYNQGLSERRAKAVVKYLTEERAVSAKRLDVEGHSFKLPDASNATIEGRSRNRRVELTVILRGSQKPAATQLSRR